MECKCLKNDGTAAAASANDEDWLVCFRSFNHSAIPAVTYTARLSFFTRLSL